MSGLIRLIIDGYNFSMPLFVALFSFMTYEAKDGICACKKKIEAKFQLCFDRF